MGLLTVVSLLMLLLDYIAADPFINLSTDTVDGGTGELFDVGCSTYSEACLHSKPIRFKENATGRVFSFTTQFIVTLQLGSPSKFIDTGYSTNGLEGFTFAILPHNVNESGIGSTGGYLGLLNATSNANNQSHTFAVEFDFVNNPEFADPVEGFHVGIDINSMNSSSWSHLWASSDPWTSTVLQVQIDYDGSTQILNVTQSNPCQRNYSEFLIQRVDLSNVLKELMYVGFTSAISNDQTASITPWSQIPWSLRTSNYTGPAAPSAAVGMSSYCGEIEPGSIFKTQGFIRTCMVLVPLLIVGAICVCVSKWYNRWVERRGWRFNIDAVELQEAGEEFNPHKFTYKELALATKNFDPKVALGRGGFGSVYKGFLPGNRHDVAVKRVAPESSQGEKEFLAEVTIIGKIRHRNLVRLQGWCHEKGELLLVYDYMPHGSLDKLLFHRSEFPGSLNANNVVVPFPWERRFKVIVDVATALVYLHTECEERIIHRDVKAANVMLDANFNARLGDFGLARSYNHSLLTPESTNVAGTFGYLAPELFHTWKQTEKTDVYSFGAFLLEVACGKKPIYYEANEVGVLVEHVWKMWGNSQILDAADPRLAGMYDGHEMTKVLCLGLLCSHPSPVMRPSMRQVLLILNEDVHLPHVPLCKPKVAAYDA